MAAKTIIGSIHDWLNLPEPELPVLKNDQDKGAVYRVLKVGFLAVSQEDCKKLSVEAAPALGGKCMLPTALLEFGGEEELCRLPLTLAGWAEHCVVMAHSGKNPFPSEVEFGALSGRPYAELL